MRTKCVAEESVDPIDAENTGRAFVTAIVEDEKILILSTEETIFLNQQAIDREIYYDAKRAFVLGGEEALKRKLAEPDLRNEQKDMLFGMIVKK
ncbi:hypothetical protein Bpfe_031391 [Biomphalaria pfeifferi]|uniref:Uncharacterized protein n=1 Tax=Biomphalaria pfeifferi TaxID=112525 RepID=A0AAD8AMZ2_BIOPF|nr:hypothetical protein Bpfe_031391 [Biomphalaria pfeifferi]